VEDRPPDDVALAERARNGDERAFEELVRMHQRIAFRTAYLLTGSASDAEDAAQAGFVKAWGSLPRFRAGAPFKPWLLRIVANEAHNRRRSTGRREALHLRGPSVWEARPRLPRGRPRAPAREELWRRQPPPNAIARSLRRYFLSLGAETATAAGYGGTVKSRTARALERLRRWGRTSWSVRSSPGGDPESGGAGLAPGVLVAIEPRRAPRPDIGAAAACGSSRGAARLATRDPRLVPPLPC
jgi:RNA polymerase sigma-70 factor (ECF subfamily)